jgi:hypothetical protein
MVLRLKTWESRSPPDLKRDTSLINDDNTGPTKPSDKPWRGLEQPRSPAEGTDFEDEQTQRYRAAAGHLQKSVAGWSSPVARQAHNLKAAGSNPAPATKTRKLDQLFRIRPTGRLFAFAIPHQRHIDTATEKPP